jgi:rubrerythrin
MAEIFEGLLHTPASDLNFLSGIQRLKDAQLAAMLDRLNELNETEGGHKGRIAAVQKELKTKKGSSTEIVAVEKMAKDIKAAEELYSDGLPYEIERIENEIRFYQAQAGESLLEI